MAHLFEISISSDIENGLNRHSVNPCSISSSLPQLPEAVVTTTGISLELQRWKCATVPATRNRLYPAYSDPSEEGCIPFFVSVPSVPQHRYRYRSVSLPVHTFLQHQEQHFVIVDGNHIVECMVMMNLCLIYPFRISSAVCMGFPQLNSCLCLFRSPAGLCRRALSRYAARWTIPARSRLLQRAFDRRSNAPNIRCCSSSVMPVPVSSTISVSIPLGVIRCQRYAAVLRELDGVGQQIISDLQDAFLNQSKQPYQFD